ncbi:hypothetical protein [Streptomyces sp. NPDC004528]|uniref:hypothetical protein n=1 Tax=Streptomyces sp. NPDC004528 TaxID=3154550 RepID=UPI0033B5F9E6
MNVIMAIDGVLKRPESDGIIPSGQLLYHGLAATHTIHLVDTDDTFNRSKVVAESWLRSHGLNKHIRLLKPTTSEPRNPYVRQVRGLRADLPVDLVVIADPGAAADLLADGYTVSLFSHPRYTRPQWQPGYSGEPRPWDDLVAEIDSQDQHYASDARRTAGPL